MNKLFGGDMLGGSSSGGLGHDDGLSFGNDLGGRPPANNNAPPAHVFSAFTLESSLLHRDRIRIHAAAAAASSSQPSNAPPILSAIYSKSKPNVSFYLGADKDTSNLIGEGNFSKTWGTSKLTLRGVPVDFSGDDNGNYSFATPRGRFTWRLDEMSGALEGFYDEAGVRVARFKPEGMLADVKQLEVLVQADHFLVDLVIFSAVTTRMFEKATVKQVKKAMHAGDVISAIIGS